LLATGLLTRCSGTEHGHELLLILLQACPGRSSPKTGGGILTEEKL
jgi:hypothetical protein